MFKLALSAAALTFAVTASTALAEDKDALLSQFLPWTSAPGTYDEDHSQGGLFDRPIGECFALVDTMRAAGFADSEDFPLYPGGRWRFKQAKQLCEKFRSYQLKIHAGKAVERVSPWLEKGDGDFTIHGFKDVEDCVNELDRLVAEGLPTDAELYVDYKTKMIVADAQKGCAALLTKAKTQVEAHDKARSEREAVELAKWSKLGVSGKRLNIIQAYGTFYLKGCELTDDPKKLAKAKVLRRIVGNSNELTIWVKTWQFKGNAVVKETEVTWDRRDMRRACK